MIFEIRIIYKSGATIDFNVTSFEIERALGGGVSYKWTHHSGPKPIQLGADEVAAVYQLAELEE